jgi:hypothetical protein
LLVNPPETPPTLPLGALVRYVPLVEAPEAPLFILEAALEDFWEKLPDE